MVEYNIFRKLHGQSDERYVLWRTTSAASAYDVALQVRSSGIGLQYAGEKRSPRKQTFYTAEGFTYVIVRKRK